MIFSEDDLPEFSMTFLVGSASAEGLRRLFPPVSLKYDVVFPDKDGNPLAKVIIESPEDMNRIFLEGETLDVDWYRMIDGEWVFVERHPFTCKLKTDDPAPDARGDGI